MCAAGARIALLFSGAAGSEQEPARRSFVSGALDRRGY
jgi:hypothetical protein